MYELRLLNISALYLTTYYILLHKWLRYISTLLIFTSVGRPIASFHLAPNLAVRYEITPIKSGVPSYLIRVWPGGQGHHVVYTGWLDISYQNVNRRLPAHLMSKMPPSRLLAPTVAIDNKSGS